MTTAYAVAILFIPLHYLLFLLEEFYHSLYFNVEWEIGVKERVLDASPFGREMQGGASISAYIENSHCKLELTRKLTVV